MPRRERRTQDGTAYAGRWVARLQGRIVGQGGTPEEARLAAQGERYKEKAEISYMHAESPMALPPLLDAVTALADDQEIHLVGGAVRDALLGTVSHDFDLVVPKNAINMARRGGSRRGRG